MPDAGATTGSEPASGVASQSAGGAAGGFPAITPRRVRNATRARRIRPSEFVGHIHFARGIRGLWHGRPSGSGRSGKFRGEFRPRAAARLIERIVTRDIRDQDSPGTEKRRQRSELVRRQSVRVEMHRPPRNRNACRARNRHRSRVPAASFSARRSALFGLRSRRARPEAPRGSAAHWCRPRRSASPSMRAATASMTLG